MPLPLFETLLDQLAAMGFAGRFSYHLYNEPLLRQDLETLVALAADRLEAAKQVLYTNGDLLTDDRYESLLQSGITRFIVTRHDGDPYPARKAQTVLVREDLELTNRGGTVAQGQGLSLPCHAPSEMLIVTATGDALLCYEDARRRHVMGNILDEPLATIWASPRFTALRAALAKGDRTVTDLCAVCDNRAHRTEGSSWFAL